MSFKEELTAALEQFVAEECGGNRTEAARRMGIPNYSTFHTWMSGKRAFISETLDTALTTIGCHVVRDGMKTDPANVHVSFNGDPELLDLRNRLQESQFEAAMYKAKCEMLENILVKGLGGNGSQNGAGSIQNVGS